MIYRQIGKTGMSASIIGLGMEHLDNKPYETVDSVLNTALDQGINMLDLFMPGETVRQNIGRVLKGKRDKVLIQGALGSTDINEQYDRSRDIKIVRQYFENLLRCLETDYIDFGMLFFIDTEKDFKDVFEGDTLQYALEMKQKGHIRALGASSHNPVIARKIVETGFVDLLMFSINPAFDMAPSEVDVIDQLQLENAFGYEKKLDPNRASLYRFCEQQRVSISVMKTLGAGKLLCADHSPFGKPLSVTQCIHYALTRPAVVSALIGCSTKEQVLEAVNYLNASDEERDYSEVISKNINSIKGNCMYCNHCLPCPSQINIAEATKYLDIAILDEANVPLSVASHYRALEHTGSECTACGSCEARCPFSVPVIKNMQKAAALFGV